MRKVLFPLGPKPSSPHPLELREVIKESRGYHFLKLASLDSEVHHSKNLMNGILAYIRFGWKFFGGFECKLGIFVLNSLLPIVCLTFKKN